MYLEYINNQMFPELHKLLFKHATWWSFKPNSSLHSYLKDNKIDLNVYFNPDQLLSAILLQAKKYNMFVYGNQNIIIPDVRLQQCFQTSVLFVPDILNHCANHIFIVPNDKSIQLLNETIHNELYINVPENIIYSDPSSLFWLHPDVNTIITNNKKIVFSWKELNDLFVDFVTAPNDHFARKDDSIFYIKEKSVFRNIFRCQYFHKNQIEDILKQITKFLGKSNTIENCCPNITFKNINRSNNIFNFIDQSINNYNKLLPNITTFIEFPNYMSYI
jgi:hypothetical protein